MHLFIPAEQILSLFLRDKQRENILIDPLLRVIAVLPDKAPVFPVLRNRGLPDPPVFRLCIHIKNKNPARIQVIIHQPENLQKIFLGQYIVHTVTDAHNRPHGSVQLELPHILIQVQDIVAGLIFFVLCLLQHLHGTVDPDHIISGIRQQLRHASCSAPQFTDQSVGNPVPLQQPDQIPAP